MQVNPARDVKQARVNNGVIRFLSEAEGTRLRKVLQADVDAAKKANRPQYQHRMQHRIFELDVSLGTGMRKGEQYSLTWPDVHFDRKEIIARDTKNGTDRRVIMIDDVAKSLKALKALPLYRKRREADSQTILLLIPCSQLAITRNGGSLHCAGQRSKAIAGMIIGTHFAAD